MDRSLEYDPSQEAQPVALPARLGVCLLPVRRIRLSGRGLTLRLTGVPLSSFLKSFEGSIQAHEDKGP